ncbi:MAG TPA: helix-turn-helix domain-containing protein [Candidatus Binataceae bacterium]|nr:helix-turn-helix domain-containing protein [Candidatus Binataceae bacterium]
MADDKSETATPVAKSATTAPISEQTLGQYLTSARERRGISREQVIAEAHIPPHYVKMIETDTYNLISDQLYLVPFLRRYAAFVGLDPEEVASRFVRDVQTAETTVARISEPFKMVSHGARRGIPRAAIIAAVIGGLILIIVLMLLLMGRARHEPAAVINPVPPAVLPPTEIVKAPSPAPAPSVAPKPSVAPSAIPSSAPQPTETSADD